MLFAEILTYIAIIVLTVGLYSSLRGKHKSKEFCFLSGTLVLAISAFINYIFLPTLEVSAFLLLFLLQVAANVLEICSKKEATNTIIIFCFTIFLFSFFFLSGLLYKTYFFVISAGIVLAAFGYKEPEKHILRQSALLMVAALLESAFAFLTNQQIYILVNIPFIFFSVLIISKNLLGKRLNK